MSQQLSLFKLYSGLAGREERRFRRALVQKLDPGAPTDLVPDLELTADSLESFDAELTEVSEARPANERPPLLNIQRLELTLAISRRLYRQDPTRQLSEVIQNLQEDRPLIGLLNSLLAPEFRTEAQRARLAGVVDQVAVISEADNRLTSPGWAIDPGLFGRLVELVPVEAAAEPIPDYSSKDEGYGQEQSPSDQEQSPSDQEQSPSDDQEQSPSDDQQADEQADGESDQESTIRAEEVFERPGEQGSKLLSAQQAVVDGFASLPSADASNAEVWGLPRRLLGQRPAGPGPVRLAGTDLVLLLARGRVELEASLRRQPAATCLNAPVRFELDGEGEFAIYLETTTRFDKDLYPGLTAQVFVDNLLAPEKWADFHAFWCEMIKATELEIGGNLTTAQIDSCADRSDPSAELIWEQVGFCDDQNPRYKDLFPQTYLCFRRSEADNGHFLHYQQLVAPGSTLAKDDGYIHVAESATGFGVTITKTLYMRSVDHQTEGHFLAKFACQAGWVDQTRHLIENAITANQP